MVENTETEKIAYWLNANLEKQVTGNEYLSLEQIKYISDGLTDLIALNAAGVEVKSNLIDRGNSLLAEMNAMINNKRISKELTVEEFANYVIQPEINGMEANRTILGLFDVLYTANEFDLAVKYLEAVNFDEVKVKGVPFWIMVSANPISPLLRRIPKEERIANLEVARCKFYDKACAFYDKLGEKDTFCKNQKPESYEKTVKEYDMLYGGNAPKEK